MDQLLRDALRPGRKEDWQIGASGIQERLREAREEPAPQRICDCPVCSRIFRDQIEERAHARGDLTLIWGIGRNRALVLENAGILNIEALQTADPTEIVTVFRAAKTGVPSQREAERWIHHATALTRGEPVVFGDTPFAHTEYIALDLEYDSDPMSRAVYLAGVITVTAAGKEPTYSGPTTATNGLSSRNWPACW